jgi:uncharacterized protein (TIGR01777 family)
VSKILITGGTGLVGSYLTRELVKLGHEVVYLSRKPGEKKGIRLYEWNIEKGYIDEKAFEGVDVVINLAGAGIADQRWTKQYKEELYNSRILSTRLLVSALNKRTTPVRTFVSTSAIGIYANAPDKADETTPPGTDFLANLCRDWEQEASAIGRTRLVIIRVGMVLAAEAGLIPRLSKPVKYGVGAALAGGEQLVSWIHIQDLVGIYLKALADEGMEGIYNAVAPQSETNKALTLAIAERLNRHILLPSIPEMALKLLFGELASHLVANQNISAAKIKSAGYEFSYPSLSKALDNLMSDTI